MVVIQNDLLDALRTVLVAPIVPASRLPAVPPKLKLAITVGEDRGYVDLTFLATVRRSDFETRLGAFPDLRDDVTRGVDMLLAGL
ncbi:MAG: CcdB family protein [Shimia sp.]